jgi:hypothetical protein
MGASKLPPQIKKGRDSKGPYWELRLSYLENGQRIQTRDRFDNEAEALAAWAEEV